MATFARRQSFTTTPNEFVMAARDLKLEVEIIPERRRFDLSVLPALRSVLERQKTRSVVSHSVKSHFLVWRSQIWRVCPWIAFHHGYTTTDRKMRVYNRLDRWSLPVADHVITVCEAFAQELTRNTGVTIESISVQHNSIRPQPRVSPADAQAMRTKLEIAPKEYVLLAVGRLSKEKAHLDLLAAFHHLREINPRIEVQTCDRWGRAGTRKAGSCRCFSGA